MPIYPVGIVFADVSASMKAHLRNAFDSQFSHQFWSGGVHKRVNMYKRSDFNSAERSVTVLHN